MTNLLVHHLSHTWEYHNYFACKNDFQEMFFHNKVRRKKLSEKIENMTGSV